MTGPNRRLRPGMRPPVHERRTMVYGIAFTREGEVLGWLRDAEGRVMLWATRDGALEGNDNNGWIGDVRQYPSGEL